MEGHDTSTFCFFVFCCFRWLFFLVRHFKYNWSCEKEISDIYIWTLKNSTRHISTSLMNMARLQKTNNKCGPCISLRERCLLTWHPALLKTENNCTDDRLPYILGSGPATRGMSKRVLLHLWFVKVTCRVLIQKFGEEKMHAHLPCNVRYLISST